MNGRDHKHRDRPQLMQERERKRCCPKQREYAQHRLRGYEREQKKGAPRDRSRACPRIEGVKSRECEHGIRRHAVIELHGEHVLEKVFPPWRHREQRRGGRNEIPVHQGPSVEGEAGIGLRDERTEKDLYEDEREDRRCAVAHAREYARRSPRQKAHGYRNDCRENGAGKRKVNGKPVLAYIGSLAEARGHHPPADCALQAAQRKHAGELPAERAADEAAREEPEERRKKNHREQAAKRAVRPFPSVDKLEVREAHALVDLAVLRDRLVFLEFGLPIGL